MNSLHMSSPLLGNPPQEYPQAQFVAEQVSQQARKAPQALALASDNESLTYSQLEVRANDLAKRLQSLGVGPDVLVGICLQRSPEMVVAALAVLKAGGAYLPMDPTHPVARLHFMLRDAQLRVLITQRQIAERLPSGECKVVILEGVEEVSNAQSPDRVSLTPDSLAYAIYTSGSTGQAKAVQITYRGLLNLIQWHRGVFSVSSEDRASQVASFGFDAAVWEIWPYLTAGASIHFPDNDTRSSATSLRDWLVERRITLSFVPTAMAESLIGLDWPEQTSLRFLLTGADVLHRYPSSKLPFVLINNYGPTECTVVATSGAVLPDQAVDGRPTIGRPIENVQIHILDESREPVPTGDVGEIYIGGVSLARGYLNRPDQDGECFVPNPFSGGQGDRLYRTGDLARFLPDGQIEFIGRADEQVKIRGYRIEPNEIVAAINRHHGVRASAVVPRTENGGEKRLIAYVVSSGTKLTRDVLQDHLQTHLPDYMVPVAFVQLDSLPLNSSGKLDRAALPAPSAANTLADHVYIAPRTPVEARVVAILAELLGLERVGIDDNFFFLGGHSLLGTQLIARVRNTFDVELSLRTVFDSPTAAELSDEIERLLSRERQISAD
jgi:amino acid adenylation domain-containing protein